MSTLQTERCVGNSVSCMAVSPRVQLQVATGGKENDLKVWDGNKLDQPVFQAKNVRKMIVQLLVLLYVFSPHSKTFEVCILSVYIGRMCVCVCVWKMMLSLPYQVRNDKLDLRVPVWVTKLDYTPLSEDQPVIAVGTGHHQVQEVCLLTYFLRLPYYF